MRTASGAEEPDDRGSGRRQLTRLEALRLFDSALAELKENYTDRGKRVLFEYLERTQNVPPSMDEEAKFLQLHQMTQDQLRLAKTRFRWRLREILVRLVREGRHLRDESDG